VTITEQGLIPEVGTLRLESGAISEFDGKTWIDSQAEKEPARSEPSPAPKTSPESLGWSVTVQSTKKSGILHADLPGTRMLYSAATWGFDEFLVVALNVRKLPMGRPFEVKSEGTYLTGDQGTIFKMKGTVDNAGNYNPFVESQTCASSETLTLVFGITGTSKGYVLQLTEGLPPVDLPEVQAEIK